MSAKTRKPKGKIRQLDIDLGDLERDTPTSKAAPASCQRWYCEP